MLSILMRYPGGKSKAMTLSYDDGVKQDIRLIEIMSKHGLKGTFNINAGFIWDGTGKPISVNRTLTKEDMQKLYIPSGNEVAVHTYTHPTLVEMPREQITYHILRDRMELEDIFGTMIRGMAYPNGPFNDKVVECAKACGIAYARTVICTEQYEIPSDWLRLPTTCHHNNPRLFELAEEFLNIEERALRNYPCKLFYLWGHAYEFDKDDNWERIEQFAEKVGGRDDIWYATNLEIHDYIQAYNQLRYDVAGTKVYNPTATDVWIVMKNEIYKVEAGKTLTVL